MSSHPSLKILEEETRRLFAGPFVGTEFPPHCFVSMQAEFLAYESRRSLTIRLPVREESLNPMRGMQGGFLAAAFDNALGPLSYLAAGRPCTTLYLDVQFIRAVGYPDDLTITARVISRGRETVLMSAEAVNGRGKLVATAMSASLIVRDRPASL